MGTSPKSNPGRVGGRWMQSPLRHPCMLLFLYSASPGISMSTRKVQKSTEKSNAKEFVMSIWELFVGWNDGYSFEFSRFQAQMVKYVCRRVRRCNRVQKIIWVEVLFECCGLLNFFTYAFSAISVWSQNEDFGDRHEGNGIQKEDFRRSCGLFEWRNSQAEGQRYHVLSRLLHTV